MSHQPMGASLERNEQPYAGKFLTPGRFALSLVPFTPLSFSGGELPLALLRLAVYGTVAYAAWAKHKPIAYSATAAAAVCLATSLSTTAWSRERNG